MKIYKEQIIPAAIGSFIVSMLISVSTMDYNDEIAEQEYKCDMVQSGAWPESVLQGVECDS